MNVSSVKNLNGEVLSAVQDASLTNVIQTNSGNWQDITAYQNASATYLTEVSIPESATWNEVSTTVQTNSAQWGQGGGLTGGNTEVESYVVTNSASIDDTVNIVTTNSGAWGGSALPISAGPGVNLSVSDNKLVIGAVPKAFYTVGISDIILTASLPVSPDANILYLIKE